MIGIIGCGNMAEAIVKGYANQNSKVKFLTYTPSFVRAETLAKAVNGESVKELKALQKAETIVIACKPQQLDALANSIESAGLDLSDKHIISILAATPIEVLQTKLKSTRVSRVMPNMPCLIGAGVSLMIHSDEVQEGEQKLVSEFFSACGEVNLMPSEKIFDQVTTVSGSGPAYVYLFAQTMSEKLMSWGLDEVSAKKVVIQLFSGSSQMMLDQDKKSLNELIASVTSKGGVTIEAIKSYQENDLAKLTSNALDAAFKRSEEMRQG